MQIVIDMPNENYQVTLTKIMLACRGCSIIELAKGHGRLIDADYLREDFKTSKRISFAERMDISCIVDHAPTIIEADTESEVEK